MTSQMQDAKAEVARAHAQLDEAADGLKREVAQRAADAAHAANPMTYVREYPWIALGLALGAGLALGLTGADKKAAAAVTTGAKKAASAIGEGAVAAKDAVVDAKDAVVDHFQHRGEPTLAAGQPPESATPGPLASVRERVGSSIDNLLYSGLQEILTGLGVDRSALRR